MIPDAGPFELGGVGGNGPAVLCIHGLTGTPYEVRPLAEALAQRGFACLGPTLPGHLESPARLNRTDRGAWQRAVLDAHDRLAASHARVYALGLSLGGLLALSLCARRPVAGAVILAAPLGLGPLRRWAVLCLAPFLESVPKTPDIVDLEARRRHPSYDRMPLRALRELIRLQADVAGELAEVTVPLRLIYSRSDRSVRLEDAARLQNAVSSADCEVRILARSGHVMPVDLESEAVTIEAVDFLAELEAAGAVDGDG